MARAAEIADGAQPMAADPFRDAVTRYLRAEYGEDMPLAQHIAAGVAYHHRGMAQDTRVLIETLLRRNLVHTVCGTTTLAQGVNFPISNVIVETRRKGRYGRLSYVDLWNVVGRAGRTLLDDVGLVGFPVARPDQAAQWQEFMRGEAQAIASQLSQVIDRAAQIGDVVSLRDIATVPALTDLLQFLSHAMRVGGAERTAIELEQLLGTSLGFAQASPAGGAVLVDVCRRYLAQVAAEPPGERVALSDQTGFSTPTIDLLLANRATDPSLAEETSWLPENLFGADIGTLAARMRILGEVPELRPISTRAETMSAERVAMIVRDWVRGVPIGDLAARHWPEGSDSASRVTSFAKYLFGQIGNLASWGLGALQNTYLAPSGTESSAARYVPSMVYFGVSTPAAVWMSMVGVPRIAAPGMGAQWLGERGRAPNSFAELRDWLGARDDRDWASATDFLSGEDMRLIWQQGIG
jgi:hypothetical protein